jgi:MoaA/NifB/PqqE/SkfB family radical SAM enzyme
MIRTVAFAPNATNVFFHILTRCNLRCRHCYINPQQHGRRTLPTATIERWLALFVRPGGEANVIFLGGEPTLHPGLPAAVRRARTLGYGSVTIDTNGTLGQRILERLAPGEVDLFSFSLDGPTAESNDRLRGRGSFARCLEGLRAAKRRGFAVSVIYTVSQHNLDGLERMRPLLLELEIDRLFIQVIGLRGRAAGAADMQVARRSWLETIPPLAARIAEAGISVTYPKVYLEPDEPFACAGEVADNVFIFPNGRVYRCPLCEDHPLHAMEIRRGRLLERPPITERELFALHIPEGCVMNRLIQPQPLIRDRGHRPPARIACCLLKQEISGARR